jgi:hypothetical protein
MLLLLLLLQVLRLQLLSRLLLLQLATNGMSMNRHTTRHLPLQHALAG